MRPRLAVALTFPVTPALGGGQVRVLHLYRELARTFDVELVSLAGYGEAARRIEVAPGLWETRVPKSEAHMIAELELETEAGVVVTDVAMGRLHGLTPEYGRALGRACAGAEAVVACHPYAYAAIRAASPQTPLCYESQDVEYALKRELLGDTAVGRSLLADTERAEAACCTESVLVWTCSEEDRAELVDHYGADPDRVIVVANGVAVDELPFVDAEQRAELRRALRIADRTTAVFLASWHPPNVRAAHEVLGVARRRPDVDVVVLGSVGDALRDEAPPANLTLTGPVSSTAKDSVLAAADVALNPVVTGSGTNIKMLDYFASGIPVIATAFGARGLGAQPGHHYVQAPSDEFDLALDRLAEMPTAAVGEMTRAARRHVEETLSWRAIAEGLATRLDRVGVSPAG